jgi:hypothetical protein
MSHLAFTIRIGDERLRDRRVTGEAEADRLTSVTVVPVPETSTWAVVRLGFLGLRLSYRGARATSRSKTSLSGLASAA